MHDVGIDEVGNSRGDNRVHHPTVVDENYLIIDNYVDEGTRLKIENGEYIDFARLLPRDRLSIEEDNRMEIVNKNGKTYFVPATDLDHTGGITNFSRWEQAFRVFSNIYTRRYPQHASELIQYNHIIHTAALSYNWENVYLYDRDFTLHLAQFLHRSWSVILQQAWTMHLKDRNHRYSEGASGGGDKSNASNQTRGRHQRKDVCWRYNSGHCSYSSSCKFIHQCAICNRYGHGAHNCCKANGFIYDSGRNYKDRNERDRHDRHDHDHHHRGSGQKVGGDKRR